MADDKKKTITTKKPGQEIIFLLAGILILALIIGQITWYLNSIGWGNITNVWNYLFHSYLLPLWQNWKYGAVFVSALSLLLIIYSLRQLKEVSETEEKIYGSAETPSLIQELKPKTVNESWERVLSHTNSTNSSDWRLAIMEADIMLEEVLRNNGFAGETVGEMLKSSKPGDFATLDAAWEAHRVRNRIAHDGASFDLNDRETHRVIGLFERVFKEFKII